MYYTIFLPVGICLTCAIFYFCMTPIDDEKEKKEKNDRIDKIFEKISSKKIIDILNNQEDFRKASSELDKKLLSLIKKEI
jgi:hypothetical protein